MKDAILRYFTYGMYTFGIKKLNAACDWWLFQEVEPRNLMKYKKHR